MHPGSKEKFYPSQVKEITQTVLTNEIEGRIDEKWIEDWQNFPDDFEILSKEISASIKMEVLKKLNLPRYKIVTQVIIGQMKDQGVSITSRCMWEPSSDNYTSASFKNKFIWASAMVFGIYTD